MTDKNAPLYAIHRYNGGDWAVTLGNEVLMRGNDSVHTAREWLNQHGAELRHKTNRHRFNLPVSHIHADGSVSTTTVMQRAGGGHIALVASYDTPHGSPRNEAIITIYDAAHARTLAWALTVAADLVEKS